MSSVAVYLIGYTVLIVGLAMGANLLGIPAPWVITGVVVLVGSGIMAASARLRDEDPDR